MTSNRLGKLFDPAADWTISDRIRPHWSQAGAVAYVTFRTRDSIPCEVLRRWDRERNEWLARRGYPSDMHWSQRVPLLNHQERSDFHRAFDRCRDDYLDSGHGRCLLRRPDLAEIVARSLLYFDGKRYRMGDFVVMPNHVHLLVAFATEESMQRQFAAWLHYSAFRIQQKIGERGHFWQQEPFDHLVRSLDQYEYLRDYIANNPKKAKLRPGEFYYYRYD
ncbi:MAG: transposase [Pirellulales bacterium]|nr:transposase [Pirellulales bacterium]